MEYSNLQKLKNLSGSHSPGVRILTEHFPDLKIKVDACFLSNPYATDLFLRYFEDDIVKSGKLRDIFEPYPSQNRAISKRLAGSLDVPFENILIGNGTTEIIQAVLQNLGVKNACVILPTFSAYYEFMPEGAKIQYFTLDKSDGFRLDVNALISFVKDRDVDTLVLINPNNPNGGYISYDKVEFLCKELSPHVNIVLDESFIHFAYESSEFSYIRYYELSSRYSNLILIKSMSKDFGIAGIRCGYAVMKPSLVETCLQKGFLWNSNGMAEYFFSLMENRAFLEEYDSIRKSYIKSTKDFYEELKAIDGIKVYESKANFFLIELLEERTSSEVVSNLLINHGVYVRDCEDKIGLEGQFIRVASRTIEDNRITLEALSKVLCN